MRSDSLAVQLAAGVGVALLPEPSLVHYHLVPVALSPRLRAQAAACPADDLFLATHRARRGAPRVRAVWNHLVIRVRRRSAARRAAPDDEIRAPCKHSMYIY